MELVLQHPPDRNLYRTTYADKMTGKALFNASFYALAGMVMHTAIFCPSFYRD